MTTTSEVVLSMEIVSLPVGGMITRIACGSTIRRSVWPRVMPSALGGLALPSSTDMQAAAHDLGHVRRLVEAEAEQARP